MDVMLVAIACILSVVVMLCLMMPAARGGRDGEGMRVQYDGPVMVFRTLPPCVAPAVDGAASRISPGFPGALAAPGRNVDPASIRAPRPAKEWPRSPPTTPMCTYGPDATLLCRPNP